MRSMCDIAHFRQLRQACYSSAERSGGKTLRKRIPGYDKIRSQRGLVDIRDVARRAKVSTATVSRTVNQVATVDAQLAKRVWRAIEELGYYPNRQARALVSGKSRVFGLIVSEITNSFFPEIVETFETSAVEQNYEILLTSTIHDPKRMELAARRMIEGRVEGVAILTFGMEDALLEHLRFRNLPLVFVDVGPKAPRVSNIRVDYAHGIRQAVEHLAATKHEWIGFVTGPLKLRSAFARKDAFEESCVRLVSRLSQSSSSRGTIG